MTEHQELAELDEDARVYMPRLFALYGVYHEQLFPDDDAMFLGWGMDFPLLRKAILWMPWGEMWHSDSAASLLKRRQRIAEARLVWLSDEPGGSAMDDYDFTGGD